MITLEFSCEPDSKWNQRLLDSKLGYMQQTKEYGYSKSNVGASPLFLKFITSNGEIGNFVSDPTLLSSTFDSIPSTTVEEGIKQTIEWLKNN